MDLKLMLSTFGVVFLAEMGDKTQLATLALAAGGSRWGVFFGSALALIATSAIAVLAGGVVARYVDPVWIHRAAGVLFIVLGLVYLLRPGE
jgi:putative Ca2+/H+ antiporter (TMEM165/GDT1 family)